MDTNTDILIGKNVHGHSLYEDEKGRYMYKKKDGRHQKVYASIIEVKELTQGRKTEDIYPFDYKIKEDGTNRLSSYFTIHPNKVLGIRQVRNPNTGKVYTNAFGKPQPRVMATMKNPLSLIDVPNVQRFEHFVPQIIQKTQKASAQKIARAIEATVKEQQNTTQKGLCSDELQCLGDTILKYNTNVEYKDQYGNTKHYTISEEEIKVWITYQVQKGLYDAAIIRGNDWAPYLVEKPDWLAWFEKGLVGYDGREYIPEALFYAGNVYQKIAELNKNRSIIESVIGREGFEQQIEKLESVKPLPLLITDDETRKLHLSPFDKIWDEINITQLADGTPVDDKNSIWSIFYYYYLKLLSNEELTLNNRRTTAYQIYYYWLLKERFSRGTSEHEKAGIRRNTTMIGAVLFDRFLVEALSRDDRNKIAGLWNAKRNNYNPIAYHKIPVGFEVSRKFKGGQLSIRPAQREGVSFCNSRGTGIVAYDVGVGKTMTSILTIADGFSKGTFIRPMIVVPQKVYRKWIAEINGVFAAKAMTVKGKKVKKGDLIAEGILPQIKVNDYDNLGVKFIGRAQDKLGLTLQVEAYSITIITYEGLAQIGFDEKTESGLTQRLLEALSQGDSGRSKAIVEQRAEEWIDKALRGTILDIEDMGIDAIFVDEAHNFRNLFMEVKGDVGDDGERESKNFLSGSGSPPSSRALSLFMLNAYVQSKHKLRNTFGLTATPFTNRATEIYSMMALYDYEGLRDFDVYSISQFCTTFIDETIEDTWTAEGKFKPNPVIRGYLNLPILQSLIFRSINYKTGEDANIQRPEKVILPLVRDDKGVPLDLEHIVDSKLQPTDLQSDWLQEITLFANRKKSKLTPYYPTDEKGIVPGLVLIALNASRTVTFSPYALKLGQEYQIDPSTISSEKFVDGSPKIKYSVECIRSVRNYHLAQKTQISGQIIYSDRGTEWFPLIKEYLVENVGFSDKEVAVFTGSVSKSKREKIKEGFLAGTIKVIIGSSTMREGVDLQKYGSVVYVCYLDWNPTDIHQLLGRIWRFGNKFSHIRAVFPLLENSADIFTWQKLSEKMSRLNSIWTKADGTKMFEESELSAEELKQGLINDPAELARYAIEEIVESAKTELAIAQGALDQLNQTQTLKDKFTSITSQLEAGAQRIKDGAARYKYNTTQEQRQKVQQMEWTDEKSMYRLLRAYSKLSPNPWEVPSKIEDHIKTKKKLQKVETNILAKYELTIFDDYSAVIDDYQRRVEEITAKIEAATSEENVQLKIDYYTELKEKERATSKSIQQRVTEFSRLNYLLDCQYSIHSCDIFGRVEEIKTGKTIAVKAPQVVEVKSTLYALSSRLKKFMPKPQQKVVRQAILGEEGPGYIESVLKPLEKQIKSIPKQQSPTLLDKTKRSKDYLVVHAHFFVGGTDWFVIDWDGKDRLFGYVILNGDDQMAELGYSSLSEIQEIAQSRPFGPELDFFWTPKYLPEALINTSSYHQKPNDPNWLPLAEMIKAGREEPVEGLNVKPEVQEKPKAKPKPQKVDSPDIKAQIQQAIEGLQIALEFTESKADQSKMSEALDGLQIALEFL